MARVTLIAVCLIAAWAITAIALAGLLRQERRQHARERDLLLNQLLHAVGKPWQPAPATPEPVERERRCWISQPEQQPIYE